MMKQVVVKSLLLVSLLILVMFGCRGRKTHSDPIVHSLQEIIHRSGDRVNVRERARLAISKWQDDVLEPDPILIDVALTKAKVRDGERMFLMLVTFDEDADLVGFVIQEEHVDSNGIKTKILEKYPVFTHLDKCGGVVRFSFVPVLVRDENQRKPADQWEKYLSTPLQQLKEEYMRRLKKKYWSWRDTLPTVWVSVPDPNRVDVQLCAFDRAGHLSERVSLKREPRKVSRPLNE